MEMNQRMVQWNRSNGMTDQITISAEQADGGYCCERNIQAAAWLPQAVRPAIPARTSDRWLQAPSCPPGGNTPNATTRVKMRTDEEGRGAGDKADGEAPRPPTPGIGGVHVWNLFPSYGENWIR